MRRGEIVTPRWSDLNLDERTITVRALNTKTIRRRPVPMSDRLHAELTWLWEAGPQKLEMRVFGIETFKRAFAGACRDARVFDFHFHDCRHTAATRLIQGGMSLQGVGRVLGHTQAQTTFRYVNVDETAIRRAAEIMNDLHRRRPEAAEGKPS